MLRLCQRMKRRRRVIYSDVKAEGTEDTVMGRSMQDVISDGGIRGKCFKFC
jgi:hypothetical protein